MTTKSRLVCSALLLVACSFNAHAAETGVTDSEIRIGQFAAQTGPAAELGKRMQLGILADFSAVNTEITAACPYQTSGGHDESAQDDGSGKWVTSDRGNITPMAAPKK